MQYRLRDVQRRAQGPALLLGLLLVGCASAPTPAPSVPGTGAPSSPAQPSIPSRLSPAQAADVTLQAISLVGTPYRFGGNTPQSGFDCSGLIAFVYKSSAGVTAPRTVTALSSWGQPVPAAALRSGDLVLFSLHGETDHAGIYVGEGRFVHAPSSGGEVRLDTLAASYWSRQQVSFRRP